MRINCIQSVFIQHWILLLTKTKIQLRVDLSSLNHHKFSNRRLYLTRFLNSIRLGIAIIDSFILMIQSVSIQYWILVLAVFSKMLIRLWLDLSSPSHKFWKQTLYFTRSWLLISFSLESLRSLIAPVIPRPIYSFIESHPDTILIGNLSLSPRKSPSYRLTVLN